MHFVVALSVRCENFNVQECMIVVSEVIFQARSLLVCIQLMYSKVVN